MALAVTLVNHQRAGWNEVINVSTFTATSTSFNVASGDLLVVMMSVIGASTTPFPNVPVSSGAGPSWTGSLIESINPAAVYNGSSGIWAVQASGAATGITVSLTCNSVSGAGDQAIYLFSLYKVTGFDTGTPIGGKEVTQLGAGNGAVTITMDAAPATGDVTLAQCLVDENTTSKISTFGAGTWTTSADGTASGKLLAYNSGYRTASTSASVPWADVNSGTDNFASTQAAVVVKVASSGQTWTGSSGTMTVTGQTDSFTSVGVWGSTGATMLHTGTTGTMVGSGTVTWTGSSGTMAMTATSGAFTVPTGVRVPSTVSGRKLLDQDGNVWLGPNMSAWGMASLLTNAQITSEMPRIAARGFKSLVVWIGGTEDGGAWGTGWHQHQNAAGQNFWTGTPWRSTLGAAWASVDHMVAQAEANGLFVWLSFCDGNSSNNNGQYMAAATTTEMHDIGVALATRYASAGNVGWHIMLDTNKTVGSTLGVRLNALFDGINDTEGASLRPVRWMEVDQGATTNGQGWYDPTGASTDARMSINCIYRYQDNSVERVEEGYSDTSGPTGDCEPPYVGAPHYTGSSGTPSAAGRQEYRERNYAVFIEGGVLINFGHEDYWHFTADGLFSGGTTWPSVMDTTEVIEASYCWGFVDTHLKTLAWAPTSAFVTTGEGTGDVKAAQGTDGSKAAAYFPDNRTIAVDTTIISGSGNVRLRWFDPVLNTYSTIAASEAQQAGRSVTLPAARGDGTRDFVLLVDLDPNQTWVGSSATITMTATSGSFNPGTATWAGSNAGGFTLVGTSGSFGVSGVAPWFSANATMSVVGSSGSFTPSSAPQTWTSTSATMLVTGFSATPPVEDDIPVKQGAIQITKVYLGSTQITKVYLGSTQL